MKWLIYSGLAFAAFGAPLFGSDHKWPPEKASKGETQPFDADLFHRCNQVYSFDATFLFWRVQEGALDYALKMKESGWGPSECFAQGKFEKATFDGDPGFRAAVRFFRAPHYWEFWAQYTRLTAEGSNKATKPSPAGDFLTGTWPQIFSSPMAWATSHIHMNYNVADLLISRVFYPNPHLRIRVTGAGTVAWINQFWKVLYSDWMGFQTKIGNRWSFIGGGLKMGTTFDWYWFSNIYMTGGATLGSLVGSYKNSALQTTNFQPSPAFNTAIPLRNTHFSDVRPTFFVQLYLGPSYQKNLGCDQRCEFFVGYELNTWLNLQEIYRSSSGAPSEAKETKINTGALCLQGLTARATYDF
jgi:hypothetical protein